MSTSDADGCRPTDYRTRPLGRSDGDPRREIDVFERQLFGVFVIEAKAETRTRVYAPACPECGRRGYHVSVCARRSLLDAGAARANGRALSELEIRWVYFVLVKHFSNGSRDVRVSDSQRGAPRKIGGARRSR